MNEPGGRTKTVTLDDLLKSNREQCDKIFGVQQKEMGLLGATLVPLT